MADPTDAPAQMLQLHLPVELGPAWLERVKKVAIPHVVRLGVIEKPDEWVVLCELKPGARAPLTDALQEAWTVWNADPQPEIGQTAGAGPVGSDPAGG